MGVAPEPGLLSDFKVLDFTGELGPYAAKLFVGLGAEVIHIEPLGGDPMRNRGPFHNGRPGPERSLPFIYYNAGKRGLSLELAHPRGREIFLKLVHASDILIESCAPGYLDRLGLGAERLMSDNPRLVQASITPFGLTGPHAGLPASDLTLSAMSGFLYLAGVNHEPPVRAPDDQGYRMAEAYGGVAAAIAAFHARRTGEGQLVEISCLEALGMALENSAQFYDLEGINRRGRGNQAGSATIHPCKDGFIALVAIIGANKAQWKPFVKWMEKEEVEGWQEFTDPKWIDPAYRSTSAGYELFNSIFEPFSTKHDKAYLYQAGQAARVAVSPVSEGKDLLENPQLDHHGFWQKLDQSGLESPVTMPGSPYSLDGATWTVGGPAPLPGEHTATILAELGYTGDQIAELATQGVIHVGR